MTNFGESLVKLKEMLIEDETKFFNVNGRTLMSQFVDRWSTLYPLVTEHIEWNGQYIKKEFDMKDIRLEWYVGKPFLKVSDSVKKSLISAFKAEALILYLEMQFSQEHLLVACMKIFVDRLFYNCGKNFISFNEFGAMVQEAWNHVEANKESLGVEWRVIPTPTTGRQNRTIIYKDMTREEVMKHIDQTLCKNQNAIKFASETGRSRSYFYLMAEKYGIEFGVSGVKHGRTKGSKSKKTNWVNQLTLTGFDWSMPLNDMIATLKKDKLTWEMYELTDAKVRNAKYAKMKELGLKGQKAQKHVAPTIAESPDSAEMQTTFEFSADDELMDFDLSMPTGIGKI